ncbi:class I SAM-dependent DNA methyltransferase [Bacillus andreraoultii]|uniref:class I SAM-dependent DNA methyltransferase n=1 Tax=Bacillus andreraoultii TaxID=1499685 RepID=UPI00053AB9E2|nr:class I SAM-dependent methyltransferase [Bacillus andreraoultii]
MGREFDELFDEWAVSYDDTVIGNDIEYREVFLHYEHILNQVANKASGTVLEFGVGTGNLTKVLLKKGLHVIGIEPSKEMRAIAKQKMPHLELYDGDFLSFPTFATPISTIVSTYAFHHLTDNEKEEAIKNFENLLERNRKIIFADTIFESIEVKKNRIEEAKLNGFSRLQKDLETEYYTTIPVLRKIFERHRFHVRFTQMNQFVWIIEAEKQ